MSDSAEGTVGIYRVTHMALKTEFVVANSKEEAFEGSVGGWSTGDYAYAQRDHAERAGDAASLADIDGIGERSLLRLINADAPVGLGPAGSDEVPDRITTRVRNRLEDNGGVQG